MPTQSNSAHQDVTINFDIDSAEYSAFKDKLSSMHEQAYVQVLLIVETLQRLKDKPLQYDEVSFRLTLCDIDVDIDFVLCDGVGSSDIKPIDPLSGEAYLNNDIGFEKSDETALLAGEFDLDLSDEDREKGVRIDEIYYFMEAADVGRPSSYANTIEELLKSGLITREGGAYTLSKLGHALVDFLQQAEPALINQYFTLALNTAVEQIADDIHPADSVLKRFLSCCFGNHSLAHQVKIWQDISECYKPQHYTIPNMVKFGE